VIRFWDTYLKPERSSLWYTTLQKSSTGGRYELSAKIPVNALKGTPLTCPNWPSAPFEGPGYDISTTGLLVNVRDPQFNPADTTQSGLWYVRLSTFTETPAPKLHKINVPGYDGSTSSAVFSPSGKMAAFLKQKNGKKESDWNRIFTIHNLTDSDSNRTFEISAVKSIKAKDYWELSPTSIMWSNDGHELYVTAEDHGRGKLFRTPLFIPSLISIEVIPIPISSDGVITTIYPLSTDPSERRLFINKTTLTDNSIFALLNPITTTQTLLSSLTSHGSALGLSPSQVSEITFPGAGNHPIHAWVMRPSTFSPEKTYPFALLIHGGPHSAWTDAWSTRWNPAIFAEAGYIVMLPNPTGSTGFGHAFLDAVNGDWGGAPYRDLEACFSYIEENMSYVDTARAVALGGSYGGYMVNWLAGQPLGKRFRALVCHDGIFSTYSMLATDVVAGLPEDMGGPLTTAPGKRHWDRFDPAQHTEGWGTPMLFIHSDLDYRCPITEGLAAFNVCQMRGIESKFLRFADEGHFVLGRENSLRWHEVVLRWCGRFVGMEGEGEESRHGNGGADKNMDGTQRDGMGKSGFAWKAYSVKLRGQAIQDRFR
jgi:dipeptidyl aminopeptidase/acylaminoacyl peptidase